MSLPLCERCRGACCEEVEIPVLASFAFDYFTREWLTARGDEVIAQSGAYGGKPAARIESRCQYLTPNGECAVHESLGGTQPTACRLATAGAPWCLEVIRRRRPSLWQEIEEDVRLRQEVDR